MKYGVFCCNVLYKVAVVSTTRRIGYLGPRGPLLVTHINDKVAAMITVTLSEMG